MSIFPKLLYKTPPTPAKSSQMLCGKFQDDSNLYRNGKGPRITKKLLKKNKVGGLAVLDIKNY